MSTQNEVNKNEHNESSIEIKKKQKLSLDKINENISKIYDKIKGKKVFIFDLETTGLFNRSDYYKYWSNKVFDSSRIIEIGYYYSNKFGEDDINIIHSYLRKPLDFTKIDEIAQKTHGITIENLKNNGYTFTRILNNDLFDKLAKCEIIISHNTKFDFYILLNELFRYNLRNTIKYLLNIRRSHNLICTCFASGYTKLNDLYKMIFNIVPTNSHRAGDDVKSLVEIILKKNINFEIKTTIDVK